MQVPALSMSRTHTDRGCEARGSSCLSSGNPVSGTVIYSTTCILCVSKLRPKYKDIHKFSKLGTTARRPFGGVESDRPHISGCGTDAVVTFQSTRQAQRLRASESKLTRLLSSCQTLPQNSILDLAQLCRSMTRLFFLLNCERRDSSQILCHQSSCPLESDPSPYIGQINIDPTKSHSASRNGDLFKNGPEFLPSQVLGAHYL